MKKSLLAVMLFSLFACQDAYAQDVLDKIAKETCACVAKTDTSNLEKFTIQLGLCMLSAAEPYHKQLKKDYNIDMTNAERETGQKLGKIVGVRMAGVCPDALMVLTSYADKKETKPASELLSFTGEVDEITKDGFVAFSIKNEAGKTLKFYWLGFIESDIDLIKKYTNLVSATVRISYRTSEYFDPRLGEYRQYNVIKKLDKIAD